MTTTNPAGTPIGDPVSGNTLGGHYVLNYDPKLGTQGTVITASDLGAWQFQDANGQLHDVTFEGSGTLTADLGPGPEGSQGRAYRMLAAIVNAPTSDNRIFHDISWREMPLSLLWQPSNEPGHDGSVIVGGIDRIVRDGDEVWAYGTIDTVGEHGREMLRLMDAGYLKGVSIDAAVTNPMEVILDADGTTHFPSVEIGAITVVAFPAFRETQIELLDEPAHIGPSYAATDGERDAVNVAAEIEGVGLIASAEPWKPPATWFAPPTMTKRQGLHIEENGQVWGHIYGWGECHTGSPDGQCITIPRHGSYDYIVNVDGRGVIADNGEHIATGPLVLAADHAALSLPWLRAKDHYANTALAFADVTCGEDEYGIWVAGAVRPGTPEDVIYAARASGPSGDWRRVGGRMELIAILSVNTQGFPALAASYEGAEMQSLVASFAAPEGSCGCGGQKPEDVRLSRLEADLL